MRAVCVDDEEQTLQHTLALCREIPQLSEAAGFTAPEEALDWVENHLPDLAVLAINMPGMDGIYLAQRIRQIKPNTAIVFLTEHPDYALDAWRVHATGYLIKPLSTERLVEEINYAEEWIRRQGDKTVTSHIAVQTFGNFDLLVDGKRVDFARSKAKELFAFLVDQKGIRVTRREAFHKLWPDEEYTRPMQKQFDVILRSLRATLKDYGIGEILQLDRGAIWIVPQTLDCDMYRLFAGDTYYENEYQGEYMTPYTWANQTEGQIASELSRRRAQRGIPEFV